MSKKDKIIVNVISLVMAAMFTLGTWAMFTSFDKSRKENVNICHQNFGQYFEYREGTSGGLRPNMCVNPKTGEGKYL